MLVKIISRKFVAASVSVLSLIALTAVPSWAESIEINIKEYNFGDAGSEVLLSDESTVITDYGIADQYCNFTVAGDNKSLHLNNNLIIRSGDNNLSYEDLESGPDYFNDSQGMIVSDTLEFYLLLGPDRLSSMNITVILDCDEIIEVTTNTTNNVIVTPTTENITPTTETSTTERVTTTTTVVEPETTVSTDSGFAGSSTKIDEVETAPPAQAVSGDPVYTG